MYPQETGDAEAALTAAMSASDQHQAHTQALIAGLGSPGGDPLTADSDWQPDVGEQGSVT
jgi:hypothetical protein